MSLHGYLTRLILLCVLPLLLLAAYMAFDNVRSAQADFDLDAANLVQNFATAIDNNLAARIGALQILAVSPHADSISNWSELYQEAQGFQHSFGSHVILADPQMHMLFNTRVPFGTALPMLPKPKGRAAAPIALETGKPAVGDTFTGPFAGERMVAIAVPVLRGGKAVFLLLATFEPRQFQTRLNQVALPAEWSIALIDGNGKTIARREPPGPSAVNDIATARRFVVKSEVSPWSVVLEIPRDVYRAPIRTVVVALTIAIVAATLLGVLGGVLASRRLGKWVASLAQTPEPGAPPPAIKEIAVVRRLLDESAQMRETAESALRESEQRFRETFEQAAVGIALVAPGGRWLRVNQKLCNIAGYSHDELLSKAFQDITHPDDLDADLAYVRQMLAGEIETYALEKRYLRKDGSIVWINLTVALARHADGSPDYFISVIEDIQQRKETEAALQASEERFRIAAETANDVVYEWDLKQSVQWLGRIDEMLGYESEAFPRTLDGWAASLHPEDVEHTMAAVQAHLEGGAPYAAEYRVRRKDGVYRWWMARGAAARLPDGKPVRWIGSVTDITERKLADAEIRRLNASLEVRVMERTTQLEASNQALAQFAYVASHDLQEPLRMVVGYVQLLEKRLADKVGADTREFMGYAVDGALRMQNLIQDILAYSRVTTGGVALARVDSAAVFDEALKLLGIRITETGAEVTAQALPVVMADRAQLVQLFQNLIGNAIKFCKDDAPRVRVEAVHETGWWRFSVIDNGIGIAPEYRAQIFVIFKRLHSRREFPGTGIGLAICKRIVERHGGEIGIDSVPGGGSVFWFTLPDGNSVL